VICGGRHDKYEALLAALAPIVVPSLQERAGELSRIVEEYAADAAAALSSTIPFSAKDRDWICKHSASSLHEIEDATLRVVALRQAGSVLRAARLLNMSHAALNEWFAIRRPARSACKRDGYDPRATNQRARRSKLLGVSHSSLGEWFQQKRKPR
jgi:DNA-binding transcriptional regulator YdaS (Cro superfamily)